MNLKSRATSSLVWTFSQQFGNQIIGFGVSLILARILLPEEFGLIGMIAVFIALGKTLLDSGLTQSLIRTESPDQEDYSTIFYFNLIASVFIYIIIYMIAPLIAIFYEQSILTDIIRIYCFVFIISAFSAVQNAKLTREMNFKIQTIISIPANVIGGVIGIVMAYMGFGVWSLVWSGLISALAHTIQLWIYADWLPQFEFNFRKFKHHFNFGYKLTLADILNSIFNNIYIIVIGKLFSANQVGFYTRAETMKQLPVTNISNALNKVTYPLFSTIKNDDLRLKHVYKKLMQMVVFIVAPVLIFIAVLAEPTFRFLFTEKWLPAVPYFQILCFTGILHPIHAYNLNVLKVKGRTDLFLKLEIFKKIIIVLVIGATFQFGIIMLLYGQVLISILSFIINTYYTGKFINYTSLEQSKDILPIIFSAIISGLLIWSIDSNLSVYLQMDILRIAIGSIVGLTTYIAQAYVFKYSSLREIEVLIKNKL
jgi:teichuronic acid exporter